MRHSISIFSTPHNSTRFTAAALSVLTLWACPVAAAPITLSTPFINFENRAINSLGFFAGQFIRVGANSVTPNGLGGTTGVASLGGTNFSAGINFTPSPVVPNFFSRELSVTPQQVTGGAIFNPWTLTFTNNVNTSNTAQAVVQMQPGAQMAPFVNSITLSGTSANPAFDWTPPPGAHVDGYRINIFDKSLINFNPANGPINIGNVVSRNLQPSVTSYTVNANDFSVPGYAFALNKNYSIEISLIQTRDGSSLNLGNGNIQAIARAYADFTPNSGGGPPVNLPVVLINGAYQFNMAVQAGQTYYIDPDVAVGYDYAIGTGDPLFQSVLLPVGIGDGIYDIYGYDPLNNLVLLADDWLGGAVFNFGVGGVDRFRVTGIETAAGLDPKNTTAFITGLTFKGNGTFTGTQTPIVVNVQNVPEPSSLLLFGLAIAALARRQYYSSRQCSSNSKNRRFTCATSAAQIAQFSSCKASTRSNSRRLLVTRVKPSLRAWAAICRSFTPMVWPRISSLARMAP